MTEQDATSTSRIHVLHVDDEAALRDLTAEFLERADTHLTVTTEADPTMVVERVATEPIQCVVSDFEMTELDGLDLCRQVRSEHPNVPFFLFTSRKSEDLVDRAFAAGVTDYLQKDPGITQYKLLANRIRNAVAHYQVKHSRADSEDPSSPT